jgi:DHA1 family bicyclomycin/chloramphenicol resistance-like MFS transporter
MSNLKKTLIFSSVIVGPFSIDIFLSGIPEIAKSFPGYDISLFLGLSLLANCLGQSFAGPFLDRFGRKPIMLIGLILSCFTSLFLGFCNAFYFLLIAKFFQTLGGCTCIVAAFAIARDIYHDDELPHTIGFILALIGISPIIAPLVGGYLNTAWDWRASFWFMLGMSIIYTLIIALLYRETLSPDHKNHTLNFKTFFANMLHIIKIPNFVAYTLTTTCAYCIIFSFLNISSLLLIRDLGVTKIAYGWLIGINAVGIIAMSKIAPHITQKKSLNTSLSFGILFMILGSLLMILANHYIKNSVLTLMIPMVITTFGTGTIRPVANAAAMVLVPKNLSGQSAGTFSLIAFSIAALAGIGVMYFVHTAAGFGLWNLVFCLLAMVALLFRK